MSLMQNEIVTLKQDGNSQWQYWLFSMSNQGWGYEANFLCSIIFSISRLYLTGVAAAQLRWHLSNMNVIQIILEVLLQDRKFYLPRN